MPAKSGTFRLAEHGEPEWALAWRAPVATLAPLTMQSGYLTLLRWRGVPIRAHWTLPLGALFFAGLAPVAWFAFFALILIHELGHAVLARRYGHRVVAIDITGFGGLCRWSGYATDYERAVIAWGGVVAQAALLVITALVVVPFGFPRGPLGEIAGVFLRTNAWLIALNLLPFPPLDGAEAWRILRFLRNRRPVGGALRAFWARVARGRGLRREHSRPAASATSATPNPELAALLRRLGDDARDARRRL